MSDFTLVDNYKGNQSNFACLKAELENVIEELEEVNRTKVTREFLEDALRDIKSIRLSIMAITD